MCANFSCFLCATSGYTYFSYSDGADVRLSCLTTRKPLVVVFAYYGSETCGQHDMSANVSLGISNPITYVLSVNVSSFGYLCPDSVGNNFTGAYYCDVNSTTTCN